MSEPETVQRFEHRDALRARVCSAFRERFGTEPTLACWAPGRVNLIGEHTDYSGGLVLPMAIDGGCIAAGRGLPQRVLRVVSLEARPALVEVDLEALGDAEPAEVGAAWGRYVRGIVRARREAGRAVAGAEVVVGTSLPLGGGLSSSAAFCMAVCGLLDALERVGHGEGEPGMPDREGLAEVAWRAESVHAGIGCGRMDHWASVFGTEGAAVLIDCQAGSHRPVAWPAGWGVLVVDSGVRHEVAGAEYARLRAAAEEAARGLGVETLREVDEELLRAGGGALDTPARWAAWHAMTENRRVRAFVEALGRADAGEAKAALAGSHASLRDRLGASCEELEVLVGAATGAAGCIGARLTGGGFGGAAVVVVEPGREPEVARACIGAFEAAYGRACVVRRVSPGGGRECWGRLVGREWGGLCGG